MKWKSAPHLESLARNVALDMAVLHVVDVAQNLELVVHGGDDGVQTVGNQSNLLVEFCIAGQGINRYSGELGEELLVAGGFLEEPFHQILISTEFMNQVILLMFLLLGEERGNDGVAVTPDVFPAPLDIMDLVGSQFGLGVSQIFGFPKKNNFLD